MPRYLARRLTGGALALASLLAVQAYAAQPAHAATTFTVTSTNDIAASAGACGDPGILTPPDPGNLTLREAVCLANNNGGASTILIPTGAFGLVSGELAVGLHPGQDVTLRGQGAGATTIFVGFFGSGRVLNFDRDQVGGVTGTVSGVTITAGRDSSVGGAGIIGGSGNAAQADSLTINNSAVTGNDANGSDPNATDQPGGGVQFIGGTLVVRSSTIGDNSSQSSAGAGVAYVATGATPGESLTVSGSTFSGNTMTNTNGSSVANGGALYARGPAGTAYAVSNSTFTANSVAATTGAARGAAIRVEGGALSVLRSTFTGNSATGGTDSGGGAVDVTTGTATLTYNRLVGNTGTPGQALRVGPGAGAVIAARNWFGCNGGPGAAGCDGVAGTATTSPYLQLTGLADPAAVVGPNGTSTITARLTRDSAGVAVPPTQLTAFAGLPVGWSDVQPVPAFVTAPSSSLTDGRALVTYDSSTATGAGQVFAGLDNASIRIPIQVTRTPGSPVVTGVTPEPGVLSVAFDPPADDGGSPVTGYQAECVSTDGGATGTASGSGNPIGVSGLTGAKTYLCHVRATSAIGTGAYGPDGPPTVAQGATVPGAPTVDSTAPSAGAVTVAFVPGSAGGSPVTSFQAQCISTDGGMSATATGAASPLKVLRLTGGKSYRCRVRATNAVGTGGFGAYGATVLLPPPTVPEPPTITSSTPSAGAVTVAFAPAGDGGSPVTSFDVRCQSSDGGVTASQTGAASPIKVGSLTGGAMYRCRVRATNAVGSSAYGPNGAAVVLPPATVPGRPTVLSTTPGPNSATVAFASGGTGGSPITEYSVVCTSTNGGDQRVVFTTTGSPVTVTELTAGKSYHCRVALYNAVGRSPWSAFGDVVVLPPPMPPNGPVVTETQPKIGAVTVFFNRPASDGGARIERYHVQCVSTDGGAIGSNNSRGEFTRLNGLTSGRSYHCHVLAVNAAGAGPYGAFGDTVVVQ